MEATNVCLVSSSAPSVTESGPVATAGPMLGKSAGTAESWFLLTTKDPWVSPPKKPTQGTWLSPTSQRCVRCASGWEETAAGGGSTVCRVWLTHAAHRKKHVYRGHCILYNCMYVCMVRYYSRRYLYWLECSLTLHHWTTNRTISFGQAEINFTHRYWRVKQYKGKLAGQTSLITLRCYWKLFLD